jgi:multidrug efflux pump subunit AcrB
MEFIINRKILISMLFLAVTMLGYISYRQLKMEIFPNAELPMLYVQISSRVDVTPDYMEKNGLIPVEGAITGLEGIEKIESTAGNNRGTIYIYYQKNANLKYAYLKLDEKINSLKRSIPEQFTLRVIKVDTEMQTNNLMNLQIRGSGGIDRVRNFVDQKITPELENIDGVASISVFGGKQKSVDVILNKAACDAYHITPAQIRSVL